jgi:hypothetical protein
MTKTCISCGMPMEKPQDFPGGDETKDWCVHCARPDGSLKSYDEAITGMTGFIVQSQGLDQDAARIVAANLMAQMPAWRAH